MHKGLIFLTILILGVWSQATPSLQRWNELALAVPRSNIAAASAKNYAILAGGLYENGTASDVVDVLDVSTRNISRLTLSAPRYNLLSASVGPYVLFAGGMEILEANDTSSNVHVIEILDVDSMLWNTAMFPETFEVTDNMVVTSADGLAVFYNGLMFATYDPADSKWTLTRVNQGSSEISPDAATALGSIVYVSTDTLTRVIRFNASSATVLTDPAQLPDVNVIGGVRSAFAIEENVYFASSNTLFIYDSQDDRWSIIVIPFTAAQGAVPIQGDIFAYKTDAQQLLSLESAAWTPQNFIIAINATAVTVVDDNYIVLAGGFDDDRVTGALHVLEYKPAAVPEVVAEPQVPTASTAIQVAKTSILGLILAAVVV